MSTLIAWIKKHKAMTIVLGILLFLIPIIIVHILFLIEAPREWLVARWTAGELLSYIASFEAFAGTMILGFVTVYQTDQANKLSSKLAEENILLQKLSVQNQYPILKVEEIKVEDSNSANLIKRRDKNLEKGAMCMETVTPSGRQKQMIVQLCATEKIAFEKSVKMKITNISEVPVKEIVLEKISIPGYNLGDGHTGKPIELEGVAKKNTLGMLLLPKESVDIEMIILFDDPNRKTFWEYSDLTKYGSFDIHVFLKNYTLSDFELQERIYVSKVSMMPEKIIYDLY